MITARTVEEVRETVGRARAAGTRVGFVPTMGFLHEGHLSLIDKAREEGAGFVVVSIFVNPTQFGPNEDFGTYPRDQARDRQLLESRNVDLLFAPPDPRVIYPAGFTTSVQLAGVAGPLEGERRPGHFAGVATVVLKLFNIVRPDLAVFGQKDAQQCAVIRRMVRDLDLTVQIVISEIIREPDGLAMSSRNAYLSREERKVAITLHHALGAGREALADGATTNETESAMERLARNEPMIEIDYLRLVDPETFCPPEDLDRDLLLVGAIRLGKTRLIDNELVKRLEVRGER